MSDDVYTVTDQKSYLATQSVGTTTLTFDFSAGTPATLTVTVKNTAPATSSGGGGGGGGVATYTPAVQTDAASTITATSAVLNGNITSDNGYDITDYGFLWGTSSNSLTNKLDVGANNKSAPRGYLSSLTAGTTYYFQGLCH